MSRKMTEREKKERARIRKELRKQGLIPPVKKRLDRKQFCAEAREILRSESFYELTLYLTWAFGEMMAHGEIPESLDKEAVGAAKVLKLAKARRDFEKRRRENGESNRYTLDELYEAVKGIYNA